MKQRDINTATKPATEPIAEPIILAEAKDQLNWINSRKDSLITSKISGARRVAEAATWRSYELKTYKLYLDDFPSGKIEVEPAPVRSIESLEYIDSDGNTQTVSASNYHVDTKSEPARILRADDTTWPDADDDRPNAVIVTFKAGYEVKVDVDASTDKLTAKDHWFSDDNIVRVRVSGGNDKALPTPLSEMTDYHIVNTSGDDVQLATSQGGSAIDLTDTGTGQFYLYEPPSVPRSDIDAMLLILGHLIENREDVVVSNSALNAVEIPNGARYLLGLNSMSRPV